MMPFIHGFVLEVYESHPVATDVEYDYKERITVSGCRYEYCSKGQDAWIMWDDSKYSYMIIATNMVIIVLQSIGMPMVCE